MKTLADLTAPAEVTRRLLEKDVQKDCVDWARRRGYWARKFSSQSQRSVPDYLFSRARGPIPNRVCRFAHASPGACYCCGAANAMKFACEFKRPGAKRDPITGLMSTEAQQDEQKAMRDTGWMVFECDDFEAFKQTVFEYERANTI